MFVQELSPSLFLFAAMCGGGGSPDPVSEVTSPAGWTCDEIQLMTRVELSILQDCSTDDQCDTVLDDTGVCATDDLVIQGRYDFGDGFIYEMLDEADAIDCDMSFITPGDCPTFAVMGCIDGTCGWR